MKFDKKETELIVNIIEERIKELRWSLEDYDHKKIRKRIKDYKKILKRFE